MNTSPSKNRIGKIAAGTLFIIAGSLMLGRNLGLEIPYWITSWPVLLMALGLLAGIKHRFTKPGAYIMILIGAVFLMNDLIPGFRLHEIAVPIAITSVGIFMLLKRNDHPFNEHCKGWHHYK